VKECAHLANAMVYKVERRLGSGNQPDDEMAMKCFYNSAKCVKNEKLRERILCAFQDAWRHEQAEINVYFNFAYGAFGLRAASADPLRTVSVVPGTVGHRIQRLRPKDCRWIVSTGR